MDKTPNVTLVYSVMRYNTLVGTYSKLEDATQIVKDGVAKGQLYQMSVTPLL